MEENILVLDAEPLVRSVVARILAREGYKTEEAGDLDTALRWLEKSEMDLIITNVYLPGITGHDAFLAIKEKFPWLPVLMISGLPDHELIDEWQSQKGWNLFPKPFAPAELLRKVNEVLKSAK